MHNRVARLTGAMPVLFTAIILVIAFCLSGFAQIAHAQEDYLDPEEAFVFSAAMATPERLDVHFRVAPKYYMYKDRFQFFLEPEEHENLLQPAVLPAGLVQYDPTFDEDLEVYYEQFTLQVPIQSGAGQPLTLSIISQGCADAGLCYSPTEHVVQLEPTPEGYIASGAGIVGMVPGIEESTPPEQYPNQLAKSEQKQFETSSVTSDINQGLSAINSSDTGFAAYLANASIWEVVIWSALFGMLLTFTPCVLPMVPILLAILAGGSKEKASLSRGRGFRLAAAFVLGMSLVYTVLGVAAGIVGASLAVWLQTPLVLTVFAGLLILFALAMFDIFTIQAPVGMQNRLNQLLNRMPGGQYGGVFVMGMVSSLIVGPCVAAPLAGVLLFISQTGDWVLGGASLFSMAWGQGVLLLVVGASSGVLLPRTGAWMQGVKTLFGLLLLATAWWMLHPVLPIWLLMLGWAFLAMFSAAFLGAFSTGSVDLASQRVAVIRMAGKVLGIGLALWAAILIVGVAGGGRDLLRPLEPFTGTPVSSSGVMATTRPAFGQVASVAELDSVLANTSQPVMLDFYADWCVSCIQMERFTFTDTEVAGLMGQMRLIQVDVTDNTPQHRELLKRFNLFGPPGIIFFNDQGEEIKDVRVVGFQNARQFADKLKQVLY